jgi:hypothetical protein
MQHYRITTKNEPAHDNTHTQFGTIYIVHTQALVNATFGASLCMVLELGHFKKENQKSLESFEMWAGEG